MGESDVNLDSAAIISTVLIFPIVVVIAGCAICSRLCRGNENEDEERQPLLTGERGEPHSRTERVENEQMQQRQKEPERHSPHSHSVLTGEQPEQSEERIEETRQQEAQPVVVAEAALIPDLLRSDEQEPEKSHHREPDILEPRPFPDNVQSPQNEEHKEVTVVKERAQRELPEPQLEDIQKQLITTDRGPEHLEGSQEMNVKSQAPTLHTKAEGQLIPNLGDIQDQPITTDREAEQLEESKVINVVAQAPNLRTEAGYELESDYKPKPDESSQNKDIQNETQQDTQEPLLTRTWDESLSAQLQDPQTDIPTTVLQAEQQQDSPAVLSPSN